jgi:hypothetical protein
MTRGEANEDCQSCAFSSKTISATISKMTLFLSLTAFGGGISLSSAENNGKCLSLLDLRNVTTSGDDTCYDVLSSGGYTFYLPSDLDIYYKKLDLIAKSELSKYSFSILPTSCKASLKAAVCQFLFPECAPGWVWNNSLTWNSIALPSTAAVVTVPYL